jgi:glutathione S-transferase
MAAAITVYGDPISGNCLKVKWTAQRLGIVFDWKTVRVADGQTRTPEFLALSPWGRVPIVVLQDGRVLSESNAIIGYLAEGSALIPQDRFERARMWQWMFWEQYSHEPYIAVRRFQLAHLGRPEAELDPKLMDRGLQALQQMDRNLMNSAFMAGGALSLADVALVAYTRMAPEGGFDLQPFAALRDWIGRVEQGLAIAPDDGKA